MVILVAWSIFPILFIYTSSVKPPERIFEYPPSFVAGFTFRNYVDLAREWPEFWAGVLNSTKIALGSVVGTILVSLPTAYALSRNRAGFTNTTGRLLFVARMFPPIVITIPLYPLLQSIGMIDNALTLIILYSAFYVSIGSLILKNYFDTIPVELEESAYIEGCSRLGAFFRIIFPLSASGQVSVGILVALFAWKEFLFAFLFTTRNAVTAPVVLNEMLGSMFGVSWGPLFAAAALQMLPAIIFVILVQRFLVRGIGFSTGK